MSVTTSAILEKARELEWEQRREQGAMPRRRSEWVIDRLRRALPPDHMALANRIMDLHAQAAGIPPADYERVEGGGNNRESAMLARCDAHRTLNGFDAAVRGRLGANGSRCFWAIAWGQSLAETLRACGYARGSHEMVKRLVQLTMLAAQDYDDECRAQREAVKQAPGR